MMNIPMDDLSKPSPSAPYTYAAQPVQYQPQYQYHYPAEDTSRIRDWLVWSIINLIVGTGVFLPLIFSIICRYSKRRNDFAQARLMSTLALVFNIIATIFGVLFWIGFIIWIIFFTRTIKGINPRGNWTGVKNTSSSILALLCQLSESNRAKKTTAEKRSWTPFYWLFDQMLHYDYDY